MFNLLYRSAVAWTGIGLASGLYYREFTKANDVPGGTQLAVVHTHALALGAMMFLIFLALVAALRIERSSFRWGVIVWNAGLVITTGAMLVKGSLQVLGRSGADSKMLAGIAGLGHMTLTAAFILVLVGIGSTVRALGAAAHPVTADA